MKRVGLVWFLLLLAQAANALPPVVSRPIVDTNGEISLLGHLYQYTDASGQLSIQQIMQRQQNGEFRPSPSLTIRQDFGYNTTATHWLYFELETPKNSRDGRNTARQQLMLEIEYANLDELELYEVSQGTLRSLGQTGDHFRFQPRPYLNNNYVFPIRLRAGQRAGYFLRVNQSYATLSFFMRLWPRPAFLASDRTEYFQWGIFIGIVCLILVLNFVMLLAQRDWIYLWYNLYLHFIVMHLFCDAGLGFQYLWPDTPGFNAFMPVYLYVWAGMVAQTTFMQYFIRQNRHNSRMYRWVNTFKWLVMGLLALAVGVQGLEVPGRELYMYQFVSLATSYLVPVIIVLTVLSLYEKKKRGKVDKMVRYYGYALAVQFTGYGLVALMNLCQANGWPLPFDVETYVVLGATLLIDLVFFTYGLAFRYMQRQHGNQQLELDLLQNRQEAQQQVIHSLNDERSRLAQDLHDDVGPLLATAKGYLSRFARTEPAPSLQQAQTLLDEAADELRLLSHELLPRQLAQSGLASALAEACRQAGRRGVPVEFITMGVPLPLDSRREQILFNIAVHLIRAAQYRAHATGATVQLLYHEAEINLSVEDDGQPTDLVESDGLNIGLKAQLLGANWLLDSTEAGTSVMINVPIIKPALA